MAASTETANAILNAFLRGVAPTLPTGVFVSLHTGDPGNNGANEVSTAAWPAYARQSAAGSGALSGAFAAASAKEATNSNVIRWPGHNGTTAISVTHFALWSAATGGTYLFGGALSASKTLNPDDEFVAYDGKLKVTVN